MKVANHKKVCRIVVLLAPNAFNTPIMFVRSKIIINKPLIIVTPATAIINARIIHTLTSSISSHWKIEGFSSLMVLEE